MTGRLLRGMTVRRKRIAVRLVGIAGAAGGLALMGFSTFGGPLALGGAASAATETIQSIVETGCSAGVTSGTLTVTDAVSGDKVVLKVTAHKPGSSTFDDTGATVTITMVSGTSSYDFTISGVPAQFQDGTVSGDDGNDSADPDPAGDDYNTWRVEVDSVVGTFDGTTAKSDSYGCTGGSSSSSSSSTSSTTAGSGSTSSGAGSTSTLSTGVRGATIAVPATGADVEFGLGLALTLAGCGLTALASGVGRRSKR